MRRQRKQTKPAPPTLDAAMNAVQGDANRSMLPMSPYARYFAGIGWVVDAVTTIGVTYNGYPKDAEITYPVSVLPERYCA